MRTLYLVFLTLVGALALASGALAAEAGAPTGRPAAASSPAVAAPLPGPGGTRLRRPLPVVTPRPLAPVTHEPLPIVVPEGRMAAPSAPGNVYNVVLPVVGATGAGHDVVLRLDNTPEANRLELRIVRPLEPPRSPQGPVAAVPAPSPPPPAGPAARLPMVRELALALAPALLSERYPAGGVQVDNGLVMGWGGTARHDTADGRWLAGRLGYAPYTLNDQQVAQSEHRRDELSAELDAGLATELADWRLGAGLGYQMRYAAVSSSLPPGLTTPFVSAPLQLFHGPRLAGRADYFGGGWRGFGALSLAPYLFAYGEPSVAQLEPLLGLGLRLGASMALGGPLAIEAAYAYDGFIGYGSGFSHGRHGPLLALKWSL